MLGTVEARLAEKGFELPRAASPAANYVPYTISESLVYVSGQITSLNGKLKFIGRLGENIDIETGYHAAQLCGLNLISQVKEIKCHLLSFTKVFAIAELQVPSEHPETTP